MSALKDEDCDMMEKCSGEDVEEAALAMEIDAPNKECDESRKCSGDMEEEPPVASSSLLSNSKRRMRKDDSGISEEKSIDDDVEDENSLGEETSGMSPSVTRKYKVKKSDAVSDKSSPDSGHHEAEMDFAVKGERAEDASTDGVDGDQLEVAATVAIDEENAAVVAANTNGGTQRNRNKRAKRSEERYDEERDDEDDEVSSLPSSDEDDDDDEDDAIFSKPKPKHAWFLCPEVTNRQYGRGNQYSNDLFRMRAYGSLHMVERLELMYKMKCHEGCVNTLHFNSTGTRLVSGSDDLYVVIWDWAIGEKVLSYESGHRSNVFQAKFMPLGGDCHIVSCARDGQVRLAELSTTGICKGTRKLASHRGPAHKLALELDSPHTFLSCGEDGVVFEIDLRESKPDKLLVCKESDQKVPLYTIFAHPNNPYEFAIGGKDHFVRVYDKRKITEDTVPLKKFCPHHLLNGGTRANVTCLVYNYNGSELLASYNDDDIYTFDTSHSDGADYTHRYQGHRNNATVKGVNYFGPKSEFVVSGSDCGNIYLWEHKTEMVVQFMPGDEGGVVNCLEPHPHIPVLATSGLDDDIKIWVPSCERAPKLNGLKSTMLSNRKERDDERQREPTESVDGHMLWFLMHHLRRSARRRAREEGQSVEESSTDDGSGGDSDDSDATPHAVQCTPS